jgi:hypothetical protein
MACREELQDRMAGDETRPAGDENYAHGCSWLLGAQMLAARDTIAECVPFSASSSSL